MSITEDKKMILLSIKNIYSTTSSPIIFCNDKIECIWKNENAASMLEKINLQLILSENNSTDIKNFINKNKSGTINACFLPFIGCKINVVPIKGNDFLGAILMFETSPDDNMDCIFDKTDHIVSILSSNLRLPMHLITNAVEILNYDVEKVHITNKEKIKKSISVVENNTYKMYRICKNLSELIRFSTNTNPVEKSIVKISDYVNNLIDTCSDYVRLSGLNVVYNFSVLPDAPNWISLDCEKINLAISNIILNSCQYSHKNKSIIIDVVISKDLLTMIIKDEGFGISKDKIKDVFRPYTTLENQYYVSKGMGIGLTLSQYIINQHDGTIELDSEIDRGTTVTINIPIVCDISSPVIQINSGISFKSKMSTIAIQFSPITY